MGTEASDPMSGIEAREDVVRERIEHVIVLMLENRSFDHMLGFLQHPHPDCFGQPDLTLYFNEDENLIPYPASDDGSPNLVDPDHSPSGIRVQMGAHGTVPAMGGFVVDYEARLGPTDAAKVMRCLPPDEQCPVLAELAMKYAVCTRWFSSVPGETWPNRNFAHAATSDGAMTIEFGFYRDTTIFETLERAGSTWRIYYDGPPQVWFYKRLWKPRWRDLLPWSQPRLANWYQMPEFFDHVASGDLPTYSFIEPAHNQLFSNSDHPRQTNSQHCHNNVGDAASADFFAGEELLSSIHGALLDNPELFERTLFVVTYDEHGGLYDHVVPPSSVDPRDPADVGIIRRIARWIRRKLDAYHGLPSNDIRDFSRLGVRVPTVLVSPWIPPGTVMRQVFEHASIPATLRALFAPNAGPLTARDAVAATFHSVVDETTSSVVLGCGPEPPSSPPPPPPSHPSNAAADEPGSTSHEPFTQSSPTPAVEPPDFDAQLADLGRKVRRDLERSRRTGVLRVQRTINRRPLRPSVQLPQADSESSSRRARHVNAQVRASAGSPLDVFIDSTEIARNSGRTERMAEGPEEPMRDVTG